MQCNHTTTTGMLSPHLKELGEDVMGFLNEVQLDYPNAISFASGRPLEEYFDLEAALPDLYAYVAYQEQRTGRSREHILGALGQYNRTKGIINELLALYLEKDAGISAGPESLLVTVGAQEAMALAVSTVLDREKDVLAVEDPGYVGISAYARLMGYEVSGIPVGRHGMDLELLEQAVRKARDRGRHIRMVYVTPDYQNPSGNRMPLKHRERLLEMADQYDFFILEDNAYGAYSYEGERLPVLKSLDRSRRVIYVESFSKTVYPGLRAAVMVADQLIPQQGSITTLSDHLAKVKGYVTVNTPSITQAVLGGLLLKHDGTLSGLNRVKAAALKQKRDALLDSLECCMGAAHDWAAGISWNRPAGGFFLTITLPFRMDKQDLLHCVHHHQVIFCPMSFFYLDGESRNQVRLAFSHIPLEQIGKGIQQLASFLREKTLDLIVH